MSSEEVQDTSPKGSGGDDENSDILDSYDDEESDDEMIDPYKLYSEAYQLMSIGEYLNSFPKFEQAFDLARNLNQMKLFDKAIADFTRDLQAGTLTKPSYCHCFRAMAYSNLNDYENSHKDLNAAIEKEEESVIRGGYHFHRGLIRNKMKNLEGAVEDFTQAMILDPEGSSNAIVFRFLVNYKLGREEDMKKDYHRIQKMNNVPEQFREDIERIGERFKFNEQTDEEKSASNVGPSESSQSQTTATTQANSTQQTASTDGDAEEAGQGPGSVPAFNLLGAGDKVEIPPEVEAEVNAMSNSEKLRVLKVELNRFETMTRERDDEKIMGYLGSGMARLTKLLEWFNSEARNWKVMFEECRVLVNDKKYEEAITGLSDCLEFEPEHTETYYLRAVCYYHINKLGEAMADVISAIRMDDSNHLFYSLMGYIYVSMGELQKAIESFIEALAKKSDHHEYYYIIAMLFDNLKDTIKALEFIDKAISLHPDHEPYMQFKLATLLKRQGEIDAMSKVVTSANLDEDDDEGEVTQQLPEQETRGPVPVATATKTATAAEDVDEDDEDDVDEEFDLSEFRKGVEDDLSDFDFKKMEQLKQEMEKELEKKKRLEKELLEKEDLLRQVQKQKEEIQQQVEEDERREREEEDKLIAREAEHQKIEAQMFSRKRALEAKKKKMMKKKQASQQQLPPAPRDDYLDSDEDDDEDDIDDEEEGEEDEEDKKRTMRRRIGDQMREERERRERRGDGGVEARRENAVTQILTTGDQKIFSILKAIRLGQYFQNFRDKNIIWFDVVHGYLSEEDYAEVFPRIRFMRRFKTYVEKYVLKKKEDVVENEIDEEDEEDEDDEDDDEYL